MIAAAATTTTKMASPRNSSSGKKGGDGGKSPRQHNSPAILLTGASSENAAPTKDKDATFVLSVLEKISKDTEMKETYVQILMPPETDSLEITISSNLVIKSIKQTSCALYNLIIGDQILNIAGNVPTTPEQAIELIRTSRPKFVIAVNRPQNREPVVYARAASIQLKRLPGYAYFVVNLKRFDKVHLGLGIRSYRNKITVNRTDENSLAAFTYLVGDSILDVNCERITDVQVLQKRLIESLVKYGACNTVVERPESAIAIHNTRVLSNYLTVTASTDPPMPSDVISIAQREIVRHRANQFKTIPKGVYRHVEPAKDYNEEKTTTEATTAEESAAPNHTSNNIIKKSAALAESFRRKKHGSSHDKRKKVNFNLKPTEVAIASDVQNAMFLQKIHSNQRTPHALTFMPRIFTGLTRRNSSSSSNSSVASSVSENTASTASTHSSVGNNSSAS